MEEDLRVGSKDFLNCDFMDVSTGEKNGQKKTLMEFNFFPKKLF